MPADQRTGLNTDMQSAWLAMFLYHTDCLMLGAHIPGAQRDACLASLKRAFS